MKTIQRVDDNEAWQRYVRIKSLLHQSKVSIFLAAAELYEFQRLKQYVPLGYQTFEAFLADPDIDLSRRNTYRLIRLYKKYVLELGCATEALVDVGTHKLDLLVPYIEPNNMSYMLNMGATLSRSDLKAELTNNEPEILPSWMYLADEAVQAAKRLNENNNTPVEIKALSREYVVRLMQYKETFS